MTSSTEEGPTTPGGRIFHANHHPITQKIKTLLAEVGVDLPDADPVGLARMDFSSGLDEEPSISDADIAKAVFNDVVQYIQFATGCIQFSYRARISLHGGYSFILYAWFPAHLKPKKPDG